MNKRMREEWENEDIVTNKRLKSILEIGKSFLPKAKKKEKTQHFQKNSLNRRKKIEKLIFGLNRGGRDKKRTEKTGARIKMHTCRASSANINKTS